MRLIVPSLTLCLLCLEVNPAFAQLMADSSTQARAEHLLDDQDNDLIDPENALEYLDLLWKDNTASLSDLHADPDQSWIASHRDSRSLLQLFSDSASSVKFRSRAGSAIDPGMQAGASGDYLGNPAQYYNRLRARNSLIDVGLLERKRPWEASLTDHIDGFASLRSPMTLTTDLRVTSSILGDYTLSFGNGLLFGNGYGSSRMQGAARAAESRAFGIRPSLSASLSRLSGGALGLSYGAATLYLFASSRRADANVVNDTIRTLYPISYYQTEDELALKDQATIRAFGGRVELATPDTASIYVKGGATGYAMGYDKIYAGTATHPFNARAMSAGSVDFLAIGDRFSASGEFALSSVGDSRSIAASANLLVEPTPALSLGLLYLRIPSSFVSPFGGLFGDDIPSLANSSQYYLGLELKPYSGHVKINAYTNIASDITTVANLFPERARDDGISITANPLRGLRFYGYVRDKRTDELVWADSSHASMTTQHTTQVRLRTQLECDVARMLILRTRFDHVNYDAASTESGWLMHCQLRYQMSNVLRSSIDAGRFVTDSYSSAIWLYQSGTPGEGSLSALYGKGWVVGARLTGRLSSVISLSGRISGSFFDHSRTIGSGVSQRTVASDLDASAQLDLSF